MKKELEWWIAAGIQFLLLPCLISVCLLGRKGSPIRKKPDLEEYVAAVTASQVSWEYQKETIKAQTVVARTNFYLKQQNHETEELLKPVVEVFHQKDRNKEMLERFSLFQEAARETKGEVLTMDQEKKEIPYHLLSCGRTRDGKEILGNAFSYIPSVKTTKDINSPLYVEGCYFSFEEIERRIKKVYGGFSFENGKTIEIKKLDSAGYVLELEIGNLLMQGEQVRTILELPSSCFTVQKTEEKVRFLCKGIGHGMGMSQYGAEQMALEGKDYREILNYFFPAMEITKEN